MKRTLTLFALVAICSAMMVSCKNTKTTEPTPEEIQAQKVALADSVLAFVDSLADTYIDYSVNSFDFAAMKLDEAEKLVKPDYLLDPSEADSFITKTQKVNALAIYSVELFIRYMYDMPLDEARDALGKLAAELNHPIDFSKVKDMTRTERIKKEYEAYEESGDVAYFWQLHNAIICEMSYLVAQNPELFYSKISNEQWQAFYSRIKTLKKVIRELANYDEEMSQLWEFRSINSPYASDEERDIANQNIETAKQYHIDNKDKYITRRNALLQ